MIHFTLNGMARQVDMPSEKPLLWVLRDDLGVTGPKFGCGVALCGACTVYVDGQPARACITGPFQPATGPRKTGIGSKTGRREKRSCDAGTSFVAGCVAGCAKKWAGESSSFMDAAFWATPGTATSIGKSSSDTTSRWRPHTASRIFGGVVIGEEGSAATCTPVPRPWKPASSRAAARSVRDLASG